MADPFRNLSELCCIPKSFVLPGIESGHDGLWNGSGGTDYFYYSKGRKEFPLNLILSFKMKTACYKNLHFPQFGGFALPSTTFLTMGLVFTGFVLLVKRVLPNLPPRETLDVTTRELLIRFYKFLKVPPILLFELSIIITGIGSAFLQAIIAPDLTDVRNTAAIC